ncbi:hypothetical protein E2C01_090379 [Portunus trituberculatus]|uniref:Uncharacterized protein n=1 Tax=Portunus trituberculatus TaxID=210409 RepID=A0A5B7JEJ5_PORTR|nr:hypothetical protein [Portunus trituberculatus]
MPPLPSRNAYYPPFSHHYTHQYRTFGGARRERGKANKTRVKEEKQHCYELTYLSKHVVN